MEHLFSPLFLLPLHSLWRNALNGNINKRVWCSGSIRVSKTFDGSSNLSTRAIWASWSAPCCFSGNAVFLITMDKLSNYFRTTIEEMRYNVTWPSTTELQKSAGLVLIGSLIFAVVVGVMDISFESVLKAFYNSFR